MASRQKVNGKKINYVTLIIQRFPANNATMTMTRLFDIDFYQGYIMYDPKKLPQSCMTRFEEAIIFIVFSVNTISESSYTI